MTQKKDHSSKSNASEPTSRDPQNLLTVLGILVVFLITYLAYQASGLEFVLLFWVGVLIGFALFHARFGFASVYRQIVETGNTEMLRAHMFMLGTATTLFVPILMFDISAFSNTTEGALSPISIGLVIGAFIFGFGMEMGSGLAPASFYTAKGGRTALLCTLFGFLTGAVVGAYHFAFWNEKLPSAPEVSLATDTGLGYFGAWGVQAAIFALIIILSYVYKKRKRPPLLPSLPTAVGWKKIVFGSWPLWVGALVLAVLNAAVFIIQGEPWKLTAAFTLWGSKLLMNLGIDVAQWEYWVVEERLGALIEPLMMDSVSVLNLGVILGTFLSLTLGGMIRFSKIHLHLALLALAGGLLMGYGATISFGANIGAYFSGIASFSLHAWIWAVMAIMGVNAAYMVGKKLNLVSK
ncbi:YeeE/YedE family protein [Salinicoccus hispanicus]|uniref:YeeE/YedE family protein n=1 Tax=Salinicoccus hispanicus TaxID=157225 RepID=A0A6N8U7J4_9STAP|nr:YeeE/YedE family protein [Salinicoccus hispanicus]MXQ51619.1 YeeE/YedE family protein [Salinicoccus hispanicus]